LLGSKDHKKTNKEIFFLILKMNYINQEIRRIKELILLTEQGFVTQPESTRVDTSQIQKQLNSAPLLNDKYSCVNTNTNKEISESVSIAINLEKINPVFVKYGLGILGRESNFGDLGSWKGPSRYLAKAAPEYIMNKIRESNSTIKNIFDWGAKTVFGKQNWVPSMGIAQMTPNIAKKYGINLEDLMTITGSLIAASSFLSDTYFDLKNYDQSKPSLIIRDGKLITPEYSTGNGRLDAAIVSYNSGTGPYTKKYCKTNNPNLLGPCDKAGQTYQPHPKDNPQLILNVTNQEVKNYLPNLKTGNLSSLGYLKEVTERSKSYGCVS
jgi:hypothetical protein